MDEELIKQAYALKELLDSDERVLKLNEAEKEMENSEGVMRLSYAYSVAQDEYNDALRHFKIESNEARELQKKLYEAKKSLDEHPLVQNYLKRYQDVRLMYNKIQNELFKPFNRHVCNEEKR